MKRLVVTLILVLAVSIYNHTSFAQENKSSAPQGIKDTTGNQTDKLSKDLERQYHTAKEFLEKFPNADTYSKNAALIIVQRYEVTQIYNRCQEADKVFFATPNAENLNKLIDTCDLWLSKSPTPDVSYSTRLALATGYGVLANFYKDTGQAFSYAERALRLLELIDPPDKSWKSETWKQFCSENVGRLLQYQGLAKLNQSPPDHYSAIGYFSKAAEVLNSPVYKDPNTYLLRANTYILIYTSLNDEYNKLSDKNKMGIQGQAFLKEAYSVIDSMIEDYARVVALTENKAEYQSIYNNAKTELEKFASFRKKSVEELINRYKEEFGIK